MFRSQANSLTKGFIVMLFGILTLAALSCPRSSLAVTRVSFGLEINSGDYDYLSEYGEWLEVPQFGMVWHPYAVRGWEPFFHGNWSWTNRGWAWVSYEPFGWLVYHYGYWYHRPHIGWFWMPGRTWSPARVQWYTYGNYCAWAPIPPPRHRWNNPWDHNDFNAWIVINVNNFADDYVGHHRIDRPFRGMKIKHNAWSRQAPGIRHIETIAGRRIPPVKISKERVDMRHITREASTKHNRPRAIERQRMVLPQHEANRVRQHAPRVEREVLAQRKNAPRHEAQRAADQNKQQIQQQRKDRQHRTIKRR